jgi:putative ABC transport system ATP-binding protein
MPRRRRVRIFGVAWAVTVLELREVVKHYRIGEGEPVRAVDGVSLSVKQGELIALYGPSGSGKTTLLMLMAALLRPDSGSVALDGREVSTLSDQDAAHYRLQELGFVRQTLNLIPGVSAIDNAALKLLGMDVRAREARRRVTPLMDQLGLEQRLRHRPEQLSMGERQRIAIARALANEPRLLLADEPTGNLDSKRSREILALMRDICHERAIPGLLVTHDHDAVPFVDHVYALRDGHMADGMDPELLATPS